MDKVMNLVCAKRGITHSCVDLEMVGVTNLKST